MENLPFELTEKIIITSVIQEIQERFRKVSWEREAKERFNELKTVCLTWRSIIETNGFKAAFQRDFDRSYSIPDILTPLMSKESEKHKDGAIVTKLKDKLYVLSVGSDETGYHSIYILYEYRCKDNDFEIENRFNMSKLGAMFGMVVCHESFYFLGALQNEKCVKLMRVPVDRPDSELIIVAKFTFSYMESNHKLSVSNNGDPIVCTTDIDEHVKVMIFDRSGSIAQCVDLNDYAEHVDFLAVTQNSNGKIIILFNYSFCGKYPATIVEVDMDSNIIRSYKPKELQDLCEVCFDLQYWLFSLSDGRICLLNLMGICYEGYLAVFDSNYNFCSVKTLESGEYDDDDVIHAFDGFLDPFDVYYDVEKKQLIIFARSITVYQL